MVAAIIGWCLDNRFLVLLLSVVAVVAGYYCLKNTPVDAIPDIGEKQVIVFADWPGRSPEDVENQVTYPLTVSLQGTPGVKTIRSMSGFGFSKCTVGGSCLFCIARMVLIRPATPAAASRCPMLALTDPSAQNPRRAVPNALVSAWTSIESPRAVAVPCPSR